MDTALDEKTPTTPQEFCTVVVVYDDNATRARAMTACDYLVSQVWEDVELAFHWWRTDFLQDPYMAEAAAQHAVAADFLIICSREAGQISNTVENWLQSWIGRRENPEGAMIDLASMQSPSHAIRHRQNLLQEFAKRGNFDYLTTVPQEPHGPEKILPNSTEDPSTTLNAAIQDVRGRSRPPSHYGLND